MLNALVFSFFPMILEVGIVSSLLVGLVVDVNVLLIITKVDNEYVNLL